MKFLSAVFILFSAIIFGQKSKEKIFSFDYFSSYTIQNSKKVIVKNIIFNSKDPTYYLVILNTEYDRYADLYSFKNNRIYHFKVVQIDDKEKSLDFRFSNNESQFYKSNYNPTYQFTKLNGNILKLDIYKNKRKRIITETHVFKTVPSDEPLFDAYRFAVFHPVISEFNIRYPEKIMITDVEVTCNNVFGSHIKMDQLKKINLELKVPN